jgi:hypothetical protein
MNMGCQDSRGQGFKGSSKALFYLGFTHTDTDTDTAFSTGGLIWKNGLGIMGEIEEGD